MPQPGYKLPVESVRATIVDAIFERPVVIIVGETGSGKTTQIPKYIYEENNSLSVAVTQPRRIAATSVATRVAHEMDAELGGLVGYSVRFDERSSKDTKIKFLTEGMLLREAIIDPSLSKYDVIFVDEAHERTTNTDMLFALLFKILTVNQMMEWLEEDGSEASVAKANELRLSEEYKFVRDKRSRDKKPKPMSIVIMSATLDADTFLSFFTTDTDKRRVSQDNESYIPHLSPPPLLFIKGRTMPITHHFTKEAIPDYISGCITTAIQIHKDNPVSEDPEERAKYPNDILVFMTGQDDIDAAFFLLRDRSREAERFYIRTMRGEYNGGVNQKINGPGETEPSGFQPFIPLRLYSALPQQEQQKVFEPAPLFPQLKGTGVPPYKYARRIILSTNVAEASLTIPGIKFVVDSGLAKLNQGSTLNIHPISRSSVDQRAGRAGRLIVEDKTPQKEGVDATDSGAQYAGGECYHVYTYEDFCKLPIAEKPEIARCDSETLEGPLLSLAGLGLLSIRNSTSKQPQSMVSRMGSVLPRMPTPPNPRETIEAMLHLTQMGAFDIKASLGDKSGIIKLSDQGKMLLAFPTTPTQAAFILSANAYGVLEAALTLCALDGAGGDIIAGKSGFSEDESDEEEEDGGGGEAGMEMKQVGHVGSSAVSGKKSGQISEKEMARLSAVSARSSYRSKYGDHVTMLRCVASCENSSGESIPTCVSKRVLHRMKKIKKQLSDIAVQTLGDKYDPGKGTEELPYLSPMYCERLLMCLCWSYSLAVGSGREGKRTVCRNLAKHIGNGRYELCGGGTSSNNKRFEYARIHPSSVLAAGSFFHRFKKDSEKRQAGIQHPKYIVYDVAVITSRLFLRKVSVCDPTWMGVEW